MQCYIHINMAYCVVKCRTMYKQVSILQIPTMALRIIETQSLAQKVLFAFPLVLTISKPSILKHHIYCISRPIRRTVIFSLEILEKNNDKCILILVIYWKKKGLLHTKISNHNIIYSSQKPRKSSSLPLKSSSWLFSLNASFSSYKMSSSLPSSALLMIP